MAYKNLIAFGAGEITPELYERGNLEKFRTGLAKLRNAFVTKTGGLKSRSGTRYSFVPKTIDPVDENPNYAWMDEHRFFWIKSCNWLLEIGKFKFTIYDGFNFDTLTPGTVITSHYIVDHTQPLSGQFTGFPDIVYDDKYIYILGEGFTNYVIDIKYTKDNGWNASPGTSTKYMSYVMAPPGFASTYNQSVAMVSSKNGSFTNSYEIEYNITFLIDGVETYGVGPYTQIGGVDIKKPVAAGEYNDFVCTINKTTAGAGVKYPSEMRVYQRPKNGGAFLFIGSAYPSDETATEIKYKYKDIGSAVTTKTIPKFDTFFEGDAQPDSVSASRGAIIVSAKTGVIYQNRLVSSGTKFKNRVFASRTYAPVMTADTPTTDDSAVSLKLGSDGGLKVLKFFDGRGLMIFTTAGMYETASDILTPSSAYAIRRAPNVATDKVNPVMVGPYVTIFDSQLKAVIAFSPSGGSDYSFNSTEFSIYSSHLFKDRDVVSWALQNDDTQILWIVMDDGDVLSFSFQNEQQLRAWARHDFQGDVKQVFTISQSGQKDVVMFNVKRGNTNTVEALTDRTAKFKEYIATDATVYYNSNLITTAIGSATVAPVTPTEWDGSLTITPAASTFSSVANDVVRAYYSEHEYVDMTVTANSSGTLTVTPEAEYPSTLATITKLYKVYSGTLTGLTHLKGQKVSVRIDGFTHASPLNTDKNYTEYTVNNSGNITLAPGVTGAFISVGLPVVTDIQTLEIDTVEQAPTKLESQIVNSLWISYFNSLFLYAGAHYPDDDTVTDMDSQEYQVEPDDGISNMIPPLPQSERLEMQIHSDWKSKGSVALRNVDPQPIAIRALIPDTEVVRKG